MFNNIFNSEKPPAGYSHINTNNYRSQERPHQSSHPTRPSHSASSAGNAHMSSSLKHGGHGSTSYPVHQRQNPSGSRGIPLKVTKNDENDYQYGNLVAVSPVDIPPSVDGTDIYIIVNDNYVFSARPTSDFEPGLIGMNSFQRMWAQLSLSKPAIVKPYDIFSEGGDKYIAGVDLEIAFIGSRSTTAPFSQEELSDAVVRSFANQILAPQQLILMDYKGLFFRLTVMSVQLGNMSSTTKTTPTSSISTSPTTRGILTELSDITFFKDKESTVNIKASNKRPPANAVIRPDFKFETLGIGGLDEEFSTIFRRAFASRVYPPGLAEELGAPHVKGILLYGPPGTGKTLIARQIGKMLNARPPKVVNGPEILDKFVGQSEKNVRALFLDAEHEYKAKGEESGLHIIILDELDAVCKQRGSGAAGGTGTGDSVVNQLLSKLDGVDQLNNILLIGMTNRLDMIDEALIRPGRLELHLEISLPDEFGRLQILRIHTQKMRDNNRLSSGVDLAGLAKSTKNFSGAEIGGLVKSAVSFAFNRHIKIGTVAGISEDAASIKVTRDDFDKALGEIKPAYGVDESSLQSCVANGIIHFSSLIEQVLERGMRRVEELSHPESFDSVYSLLLHGKPGSGKTALAAKIALDSQIPFVKVITQDDMIGFNDMSKINHLHKIITDAYKSKLSVIVLDNIEKIIDWSDVGPRFSLPVLQAVNSILTKSPPHGHRLFIIGSSSEPAVLQRLKSFHLFSDKVAIPYIRTHRELQDALSQIGVFSGDEVQEILSGLHQDLRSDRLSIGIKKVLQCANHARVNRRFGNVVDSFVHDAIEAMDEDRFLNGYDQSLPSLE